MPFGLQGTSSVPMSVMNTVMTRGHQPAALEPGPDGPAPGPPASGVPGAITAALSTATLNHRLGESAVRPARALTLGPCRAGELRHAEAVPNDRPRSSHARLEPVLSGHHRRQQGGYFGSPYPTRQLPSPPPGGLREAQVNSGEQACPPHVLELLAVVLADRVFRHCILGSGTPRPLGVLSDCSVVATHEEISRYLARSPTPSRPRRICRAVGP